MAICQEIAFVPIDLSGLLTKIVLRSLPHMRYKALTLIVLLFLSLDLPQVNPFPFVYQ